MSIRLKLTLGLGLLFIFIIVLSLTGTLQINNLAGDTRNILRANYNTLDYARQMLTSLDKLGTEPEAVAQFRLYLQKQQENVTEKGEQAATDKLKNDFHFLLLHPEDKAAPLRIRKDIDDIMFLNMEAISRKSLVAEKTAREAIGWISATGTLCFLVALVLLVNLPGYIANPIQELTRSIEAIAAKNYNQRIHFKDGSEFGKLSAAFNSMAEKLEEYHNSKISELLMEKKRIDTLINNMQDPVIGLDEHHKILFINDEALKITGLKREEVAGRQVQDIAVHNDLIRALVKDLILPAGTEQTKQPPLKIYAHDKESYFDKETVTISIVPTGEQAKKEIGHVILLKNITSFKELDTAKTNFIATVSHELKTPISSIKMSLLLLRQQYTRSGNDEQQQLLESIEEDSNRLLKITGELLNMTQVETGNIQLNIQRNRPDEMIRYAADAVGSLAERKQIALRLELASALPDIHADVDKTAWVLVNFLTNAIRYSPENSPVILEAVPEGKGIRFSVTDSGPGIEDRYQDKIFDRYFQVPGSIKTGTGLGLAISKEFIEAQGGTIGVDSRPREGSRFYFVLPA